MMGRIPLLVIAGPTASGKTALAVEICRRFDGEVISADSMQVYDHLRVGTARPTAEEMQGIPHHLMGFLPPSASFSVARYAAAAHEAIADVAARGKLPVLCGGTGLYIGAVVDNLQYEDQPADRTVRDALNRRADAEGTEMLLQELAAVDPDTAARLHPHDRGRIVRALEIYRTTGRTITEQNAASRAVPSPYDTCGLRLDFHDRAVLYDRIDRRVGLMLEQGLLDEAVWLRSQTCADTIRQAIGYKEFDPYFDGEMTLDAAADALRQGTRRYAKRQLSWFRHQPWMVPLYVDDGDVAARAADVITTWKEGDG